MKVLLALVKVLLVSMVIPCVLGPAGVEAAAWIFDSDIGVVYESNVGLAQDSRDIKSDVALNAALSAGAALPLADRLLASVTADVSGAAWERLDGLNNLSLGLTTALRSKLGLGSAAPWLRVWASAARLVYEEDLRDGWRYRAGVGAGKRLGERWDVRADYVFERRTADHDRPVTPRLPGDVFDQTSHTMALRTDFLYTESLSLFAGYALRLGDVASTTRRNPEIFAASTALTADPAFGRDFFAYKIDATVHIPTIGLSFALGPRSSLNLSYERQIGLAHRGIEYHNDVFRLGLLFSQ